MANQKVMQAWAKALRSGEYKQTTGALRRSAVSDTQGEGYCCLGVLCDIAAKNPELGGSALPAYTWRPTVVGHPGSADYLTWNKNNDSTGAEASMPPVEVAGWAGVDPVWGVKFENTGLPEDERADATGGDERVTLAYLNDAAGFTFEQIADAIEKEFVDA